LGTRRSEFRISYGSPASGELYCPALFPANTLVFRPAIPEEGGRIAFLCGCAEPGKDGVGDYTALLAGECERRGLATLRVALNDPYVTGAEVGEGTLRLGADMRWNARVEQAREAVERFGADMVSLQWVPYAFHGRGIPWGIEKGLGRIAAGRAAQVMCHEVWIGGETGASLGHRLTGAAQRMVMRRILRALRPGRVQTSNAAYAALLGRAGFAAEVLPMFGAIPVTGAGVQREGGVLRFGMFGALHPEWPPEPLLGRLRGLGKRLEIEHIGRMANGEETWRAMERRYGGEFGFKRHGEQPAARVSQFLTEMDFGIATTPLALIGKSATVAAMLEHGLPVIVNRDDVRYAGVEGKERPEGIIAMSEGLADTLRSAARREARSRLPEVADQFLESLRRPR
jgi:hypothetical protein